MPRLPLRAAVATASLLAPACVAPRGPAPPRPAGAPAAASADSLRMLLDQRAPAWLARAGVPSVAVAYIEGGAVRWTRVYGEQAPGVPATTSTLYNVASLAKPVFAEVVLRLAAAGRVALDEPMAAHWADPDLAGDARLGALTPRVALSHRTGFANWRRETGGVLRFRHAPGAAYGYSGEGFQYVRRFAEAKLGTPLDALARQYVFGPDGMAQTAFARQSWFEGRVALPMGSQAKYGEPAFPPGGNAADDLYTTIGDYAAFVVGAMHRRGLPDALAAARDSVHVADTASVRQCRADAGARCPDFGQGLGWAVLTFSDHRVLWHTGSDWGEKAMALYSPERRDGLVMFTNGANGQAVMLDVGLLLSQDAQLVEFFAAWQRAVAPASARTARRAGAAP